MNGLIYLVLKNWMIKLRHPLPTVVELLIPILSIYLLVFLCNKVAVRFEKGETMYKPYNISKIPENKLIPNENMALFYTPNSQFMNEVMSDVASILDVTVKGFLDEEELVRKYLNSSESDGITGIVFTESKNGNSSFIKYTIRPPTVPNFNWDIQYTYVSVPNPGPGTPDNYGTLYMTLGFLPIQHAIAMALIKKLVPGVNNTLSDFHVRMQRNPYPKYSFSSFYLQPSYFSFLLICAGFIFPFSNIAKYIVVEKEKGLQEVLEIMGVGKSLNRFAWYFSSLAYFCLLSGIITFMLCFEFSGKPAIFQNSYPSVVFLWLSLYSSSSISFCCFIASIYNTENAAFGVAVISFLMTTVSHFHLILIYDAELHLMMKLPFCLFPNPILCYSLKIFSISEVLDVGLNWSNISTAAEDSLKFTMIQNFYIFVFQSIFYSVLSWYVEIVFPGKFGNPMPWYFFVTKTYWFGLEFNESEQLEAFGIRDMRPEYFERDPYGVLPMIEFKHLTKVFHRNKKPSVKKVCLKAYKGCITVLLGHVGSGKSATVSLVLGRYPPTSGGAFIKSLNVSVRSEARTMYQIIGFCPDYDICIDELTVHENLSYFCQIKGYESNMIKPQVDYILYVLSIDSEMNTRACHLNPSVKRKLSVGIALIGESEVVIIENPTRDMDSDDQKIVWDALKSQKGHRTIFVTTRHMKEATAIADRIAVIDEGEIQCCGSSTFLKEIYGAGYHLSIEKEDACNVEEVTKLIQSHIPGAKLHDSERRLRVVLHPDQTHLYPSLFNEIEEKREKLKITSLRISERKLHEMFDKVSLKATADFIFRDEHDKDNSSSVGLPAECQVLLNFKERNEKFSLFLQQAISVFKNHYLFSMHYSSLTLFQILLLTLYFMVVQFLPEKSVLYDAELNFDLKIYEDYNIALDFQVSVDMYHDRNVALSKIYKSLINEPHTFMDIDLEEETLEEHLLELADYHLFSYNEKNVIAADITKDGNLTRITSFYNGKAYHSAPLSLLFVHNTILKYLSNERTYYFLNVSNQPLPLRMDERLISVYALALKEAKIEMAALDLIVGISHIMASFIIFLMKEKSSQCKRLQIMSGLKPFHYWILNFLYDLGLYIIAISLFIATVSYTKPNIHHFLEYMTLLLAVSGMSGILSVYLFSFFFDTPFFAYTAVFIYISFGYACHNAPNVFMRNGYLFTADTLDTFFSLFFPGFCIVQGVFNLDMQMKSHEICNLASMKYDLKSLCEGKYTTAKLFCCKEYCGSQCLPVEQNFLSFKAPGIGKQLISPLIQSCFFVLAIVCCETNVFYFACRKLTCLKMRKKRELPTALNKRIIEENKRILTTSLDQLLETYPLVVQKATKYYDTKLAIQNLTFGVKKGECFGLIGPDQSGKKTTVAMITGNTPMSSGTIFVNGKKIDFNSLKVFKNVGICPHSDGLMIYMTGEEILQFYANLKGIPSQKISSLISYFSSILAFDHVLKEKIKKYNICNKRKLSVAIALIGSTSLMILEEPTADLDPTSCRHIWNTLLQTSALGCTILLTSDRMDECEAVCNKVGIIVKGKMVYMGSLTELKNNFGDGYTVAMYIPKVRQARKLVRRGMDIPKMLIETSYPEAVLKLDQTYYSYYYIPEKDMKMAKVFNLLEEIKSKVEGLTYSVRKANLDHVYLHETVEKEDLENLIN